jgi:hypothetical protein
MTDAAIHSDSEVDGIGDDDVTITDNNNNNNDADDDADAATANSDDKADDTDKADDDTAKEGYSYKPPTKKVYVPVYVPEQEKKKMKIISVDKGFYIQGGLQLFGKFKTLKHCMKACAVTPTCFQGDYNPWLHKCYQHTNYTACQTLKSHPQYVHFSKVPCTVTDAPRGHVTLGASMANGLEQKGIDNLSQCIKKCVGAGLGIPASVAADVATAVNSDATQSCFAVDYDFATHKCFFFQQNFVNWVGTITSLVLTQCNMNTYNVPSAQGTRHNPTSVHISFCPTVVG